MAMIYYNFLIFYSTACCGLGESWSTPQAGRAEFRGLAPHGSGKCCVSPSRPLASERLRAARLKLQWSALENGKPPKLP